jgi:hypothetical protein
MENKKMSEKLTVTRPTWNNEMLKELAKVANLCITAVAYK